MIYYLLESDSHKKAKKVDKETINSVKECIKDYLFDNEFFRIYVQPFDIDKINKDSKFNVENKFNYERDKTVAFKIYVPSTERFIEISKFIKQHNREITKRINSETSFKAKSDEVIRFNNSVIAVYKL